jgi:hypothetical protein
MSTLARRHLAVRAWLALLLLTLLAMGCGGSSDPTPTADASEVELHGVITEVFPHDPGREPTRFALQTSSGLETIHLRTGFQYGFPLQHLREHARTQDPVAVVAETDAGNLYALSIADA